MVNQTSTAQISELKYIIYNIVRSKQLQVDKQMTYITIVYAHMSYECTLVLSFLYYVEYYLHSLLDIFRLTHEL